jgi:hypothetical protein
LAFANERAFVLFPVGYPEPNCLVPDLQLKPVFKKNEAGSVRSSARRGEPEQPLGCEW